MAEVSYNVGDDLISRDLLFSKVFLNAPYPLARQRVGREKKLLKGEYSYNPFYEYEENTFYPIVFRYNGTDFQNGVKKNVNFRLEPRLEPMFDFTLQKNVVMTPIAGRDYTVKEIISAEDWQVRIRGFFIYDNLKDGADITVWRLNTLQALNDLAKVNAAIQCDCEAFVPLGFDRIVIKGLKLPMVEGFANMIPYEIDAVSDVALELEILKG